MVTVKSIHIGRCFAGKKTRLEYYYIVIYEI